MVVLWRRKQPVYSYQLALMEAYRPFTRVTRDALEYDLAHYGFDASALDVDALLAADEALDPFDAVGPALDRLAEDGPRLGVLSNGNPDLLAALVDHAGVDDRFEAIVSADEVGTFEPAPAVYERTAERLSTPLASCMLVSSNAWDAAGAAHAGMGAAWIDRSGDPPERIGVTPDLTLTSLRDLQDELQ